MAPLQPLFSDPSQFPDTLFRRDDKKAMNLGDITPVPDPVATAGRREDHDP
jgi:hypothetical protein